MEDFFPFERQDGFWMKLDSMDGKGFVPEPHDFVFGRTRTDFETVWERFETDDEGVVAGCIERVWKILKNSFSIVEDGRGFPVHQSSGTDDFAAENVAHALVAEADAKHRKAWTKGSDDVIGDASFIWGARAWRDADAFGMEGLNFGEGDLVVAFDEQIGTEFAEVLDQIVGERVVVIDDQQHRVEKGQGLRGVTERARAMAAIMPMALLTHS